MAIATLPRQPAGPTRLTIYISRARGEVGRPLPRTTGKESDGDGPRCGRNHNVALPPLAVWECDDGIVIKPYTRRMMADASSPAPAKLTKVPIE